MLILKLFFLTCSLIHLVTSQMIRITQHPANATYCEGSNAVLSCVIFDNSTNNGADTTVWFTNDDPPVAVPPSMISNSRNGDVVTSVLTVESVSLNDNGNGYFCFPVFGIASYVGVISVAGPPVDISDIHINEVTACSFAVKWSKPSSNNLCDPVWYTVTISTGGMVVITDNTTLTNYTVTGLNDNTAYHVSVTANNNAGSSGRATSVMAMTNSNGLPSSPPQITAVKTLSSTSFTVSWTITDPDHNYIVTWTNLNSGVMDNYTVSENISIYTVRGLSDNDNFDVSITAVGVCGMKRSDPVTVYDPPNEPQFEYCISYNNGTPVLQVISNVTVNTPGMSLSLTFSAIYQTGNNNSQSEKQSATCSLLSDMQYNCKAEFAFGITPPVDAMQSVNVTVIVDGPYGNNSSLRIISERVNSILSVDKSDITEKSCTLISKLPCSSPELLCVVSHLATNNVDVNMDVDVHVNITNTAGYVSDPEVTYNYPAHIITVNRLNSSTTYNYCIMAINSTNATNTTSITDMPPVGKPMCGNFTTVITTTTDESHKCEGCIIGICVGILIAIVLLILITIWWCYKAKRSREKIDGVSTSKSTIIVAQLGDNPAYVGMTATVTDDDKKILHAEANVQESMTSDGTIKDDETVKIVATNSVQLMATNNMGGQWYDHLADDNTKKPDDDDDGNPMTNVGEVYHFNEQYQVNDTNEQQSHNDDEASREKSEQQSPVNAANTDKASVKSSEESTSLHTSNEAETTANNTTTKASAAAPAPDEQSPVNAAKTDEGLVKSSDESTSLPPTINETVTTASNTATKTHAVTASAQEQQSPVNPANTGEVPVKRSEESTSLSTSNEASITASSTDTKTPAAVPVNFYDPIQRYPSVIPHLNTSSGDKYALPSHKTKRVTKQSDNTASVNQEIPPYAIPDKSKKTRNQNTKHTDLDALPSPTADETQQINYADLEPLPPPASSMIPIDEGTNMYAKIA